MNHKTGYCLGFLTNELKKNKETLDSLQKIYEQDINSLKTQLDEKQRLTTECMMAQREYKLKYTACENERRLYESEPLRNVGFKDMTSELLSRGAAMVTGGASGARDVLWWFMDFGYNCVFTDRTPKPKPEPEPDNQKYHSEDNKNTNNKNKRSNTEQHSSTSGPAPKRSVNVECSDKRIRCLMGYQDNTTQFNLEEILRCFAVDNIEAVIVLCKNMLLVLHPDKTVEGLSPEIVAERTKLLNLAKNILIFARKQREK